MPQIGWFEIIIVAVIAILIIGPKDFPIMVKRIGSWVGYLKRYFFEIQKEITDVESEVENIIEDDISLKNNYKENIKDKKKDE